jgi:hypothetical protein
LHRTTPVRPTFQQLIAVVELTSRVLIGGVGVQDLARRYQSWPVGYPKRVRIGRRQRALAVAEGAITTLPPQISESRARSETTGFNSDVI